MFRRMPVDQSIRDIEESGVISMAHVQRLADERSAPAERSVIRSGRVDPAQLLAVICPYRGENPELLSITLTSLRAQARDSWTFLVAVPSGFVDSTDELEEAIAGEGAARLVFGNSLAGAVNRAIASTWAEFVTVVDPGDTLLSETTKQLHSVTAEHAELDVVYTDESWSGRGPSDKRVCGPELPGAGDALRKMTAVRATVAQSVGGFGEGARDTVESDFYRRCSEVAREIVLLPRAPSAPASDPSTAGPEVVLPADVADGAGLIPPPVDRSADPADGPEPILLQVARVCTYHGSWLHLSGDRLRHGIEAGSDVLLVLDPQSGAGMLVAEAEGRCFRVGRGGVASDAHHVLVRELGAGTVGLLERSSRRWLSFRPLDASGVGESQEPSPRAQAWEALRLSPAEPLAPERMARLAGAISNVAAVHRSASPWEQAVRSLESCGPDELRVRTEGVLRSLSLADRSRAAATLLDTPGFVGQFADAFPDDLWATEAVPALVRWCRDRDAQAVRSRRSSIGTGLDHLGVSTLKDAPVSPAHLLSTAARASIVPRKRVCVLATVRNEGVYLLEWIAYHRALGIDEILVYSNGNSDGSDELLDRLAAAGVIRWVDSIVGARANAQGKAYGHSLSIAPDVLDYYWVAVIDTDEYLAVNRDVFSGLTDFLDWHRAAGTDVIGVNWAVVAPSDHPRYTPEPLTERCSRLIAPFDSHIKSISRPQAVLGSRPHFPSRDREGVLAFREADGSDHTSETSTLARHIAAAQSDHPSDSHAILYHFALRSVEEFLWKFSRNRGDYPATSDDIALTLDESWARRFLRQQGAKGAGNSRTRLRANVPDLAAEIEVLREKPGVAAAERRVQTRFGERLRAVIAAYKEVLANDLGEPGARLLHILEGGSSAVV